MNISIVKGQISEISEVLIDKNNSKYITGFAWIRKISLDNRLKNVKVNFFIWDSSNINIFDFKENFLNKTIYLIGYQKSLKKSKTNIFMIDEIILKEDLENKNKTQEIGNLLWKVFG